MFWGVNKGALRTVYEGVCLVTNSSWFLSRVSSCSGMDTISLIFHLKCALETLSPLFLLLLSISLLFRKVIPQQRASPYNLAVCMFWGWGGETLGQDLDHLCPRNLGCHFCKLLFLLLGRGHYIKCADLLSKVI